MSRAADPLYPCHWQAVAGCTGSHNTIWWVSIPFTLRVAPRKYVESATSARKAVPGPRRWRHASDRVGKVGPNGGSAVEDVQVIKVDACGHQSVEGCEIWALTCCRWATAAHRISGLPSDPEPGLPSHPLTGNPWRRAIIRRKAVKWVHTAFPVPPVHVESAAHRREPMAASRRRHEAGRGDRDVGPC